MIEWKSQAHFVKADSKAEGFSEQTVSNILDAHDKADYELTRHGRIVDLEKLLMRIEELTHWRFIAIRLSRAVPNL